MYGYYSSLPLSPVENRPIVSYHPRWYGRLLIRLSHWLYDLAYVGAIRIEE